MSELELLQSIADNSQAAVEILSFVAGLMCSFVLYIWKG